MAHLRSRQLASLALGSVFSLSGCMDPLCWETATCPIEPDAAVDAGLVGTTVGTFALQPTASIGEAPDAAAGPTGSGSLGSAADAGVPQITGTGSQSPPPGIDGSAPTAAPDTSTSPAGALGSTCNNGTECESTHCVDGYCCESTCAGVCSRCDAPGSEGTCIATESDEQCPALQCPTDTECSTFTSDSLGQNCEDVGVCRTSAECESHEVTESISCLSGTGTCLAGVCDVPNKKNQGEDCTSDSDCGTNNCAAKSNGEKVCCSAPCDGVCEACGDDGVCSQAPADDARCVVDCDAGDQCTHYPPRLTTNRCNGFRQCVASAQYCAASYEPTTVSCGASYYCDGQGGCVFRDTAVPFVSGSTPQNNASAVDTAAVIDIQFSEPMNTSSTSGATLTGPTGNVSVTVSWNGNTHLLVSPNAPLLLFADYTLTLGNALRDAAGNALAPTTISFKTRDGVWEATPTLIETVNTGDARNGSLVVDSNNKVTALWLQNQTSANTSIADVRSNQFGTNWGSSILAENVATTIGALVAGGADNTGKVYTLWSTYDGSSTYTVQSSTLSNGNWTATRVYTHPSVLGIDFATNASGSGLACITTRDAAAASGMEYTVLTASYSAASGWSPPSPVASALPYTGACNVALDGSGNAILAWNENWRLRYSYRASGGGWSAASDLDPGQTNGAYMTVSVDSVGAFWVMWKRETGANGTVHVRRKAPNGGSWGSIGSPTSQNGGDAYPSRIVGDGLGNAMATWYEYAGTTSSSKSIQASYYNGSWSQSTSLSDDTGDSRFPVFAFDSRGNGMLVWSQPSASAYYEVARRYLKGQGWGNAYKFNAPTNPTGSNVYSTLGIDSLGVATTVWSQSDGTRANMWALRFK